MVWSEFYGISWLQYPASLPIGQLIEFSHIEFTYNILPHFGIDIKNQLICKTEASSCSIIDITVERLDLYLEKFIRNISKSLQSIIKYNNTRNAYSANTYFRPRIFDSIPYLIKNKRLARKAYILCEIKNHVDWQRADEKWMYIFNIQFEGILINVVKFADCRFKNFIGHCIDNLRPVIFGNVQFQANLHAKHNNFFSIKKNSFFLYNFCTEISNLLLYGCCDITGKSVVPSLWPSKDDSIKDHLCWKEAATPHFTSFDAAIVHINTHQKATACFTIRSDSVIQYNDIKPIFRVLCTTCRKLRFGLKPHCHQADSLHPFLECNLRLSWNNEQKDCKDDATNNQINEPESKQSDSKQNIDNQPIESDISNKKITVSLDVVKQMYDYLKKKDIELYESDDNSMDIDQKDQYKNLILASFENGAQAWKSNEQSIYYKPLLEQFWKTISQDHTKQLRFNIKKRKSAKLYTIRLSGINDIGSNENKNNHVRKRLKRPLENADDSYPRRKRPRIVDI